MSDLVPWRALLRPERSAWRWSWLIRGRFNVLRTDNRDAKNVRLKLHEQIVTAGAAIDTQFVKLNAGVGLHRCENVRYLVGDAFKGRPGNMARLGAARETDYPSLRVWIPIRRAQTGEGRICSWRQSAGSRCSSA